MAVVTALSVLLTLTYSWTFVEFGAHTHVCAAVRLATLEAELRVRDPGRP